MLDYYKILGVSRSADYTTIRSAYKKLALQYHPDRNPNNKAAEEVFKVINEAKQRLSDPQKRAQYDLILNYIYEASQRKVAEQTYSRYKATQSYTRYQGQSWQPHQNFPHGTGYKIDKNYYKVQLLTLIVVALISMLSIGIFKATEYLEEKKNEEIRIENEKILAEAQQLYDKGDYRNALNMVISLIRKNPIEKKYFTQKESMVAGLNNKAISLYQNADYKKAVANLEILREYQSPMQLSTWNMIADCNYKLGIYSKAIHALEYVRIRDQGNIELVMRIGDIYYNDLHMTDKALEYYDKAKEMFKSAQSSSYGEAFELVMPPEQTPQIYFDIFSKRAEINMASGNYQEAITDYNWAVFLRPKNATSYHYRGICRQKNNNYSRACKDWVRALSLGSENSRQWINKYCR